MASVKGKEESHLKIASQEQSDLSLSPEELRDIEKASGIPFV